MRATVALASFAALAAGAWVAVQPNWTRAISVKFPTEEETRDLRAAFSAFAEPTEPRAILCRDVQWKVIELMHRDAKDPEDVIFKMRHETLFDELDDAHFAQMMDERRTYGAVEFRVESGWRGPLPQFRTPEDEERRAGIQKRLSAAINAIVDAEVS